MRMTTQTHQVIAATYESLVAASSLASRVSQDGLALGMERQYLNQLILVRVM